MRNKRKATSDAVEILHRRYYEGKPKRVAELDEARAEDEIARRIYELREQAGLTQERLARLVGTTPSVISRLEDADYEGHRRCRGQTTRDSVRTQEGKATARVTAVASNLRLGSLRAAQLKKASKNAVR